ncbi:MAG: ATP-binding protein [bacterium]|nr:ATP-binding protein [bacterium]
MRITQSIENEYKAARTQALREAEARRKAAYAALPRLAAIEEEKNSTAFALGLKLRDAEDPDALRAETAERIAALNAEAERLLADNGIAPEMLKPQFRCKECEDTGFVGTQRRMCACLRKRLLREEYASSGFAENACFERFDTGIYKDETQRRRSVRAKEICEEYAEQLSFNGARGLLLLGDAGLGKTFLLDCIGQRALARGHSVQKYTAYNLLDRMLRAMRERDGGLTAAGLAAPDLLLIDDLGTEPFLQNVTYELLFSAINERQNAGKATAIATNLGKAQILEDYGERLFSRMTSPRLFSVIELKGKSLR